jgi:glycosyltransferase involved in cell wall biosynthesis
VSDEPARRGPRRRVAIAYDCLFPWTVGGAERWYRALAEGLARDGFEVTYLTRLQWGEQAPAIEGVEVVAVVAASELYDAQGRRLLGPTLRYGWGVFRHLVSHRHRYQIVHTANFPFWSLLGAWMATVGGAELVVDWHEIWSFTFWREYAGRPMGLVGWLVQLLCVLCSTHPVTTSELNAARFRRAGGRRDPLVLPGYLPARRCGEVKAPSPAAWPPYALFAGRHIRDKGIDLIPGIAAALASRGSSVRLVVVGDGPRRRAIVAEVERAGLAERVEFRGFVPGEELHDLMAYASCLIVPSRREGYGMAAVEAMQAGVPVVVAAFPENLAAAHVEQGRNGYLAAPTAAGVAHCVEAVVAAGDAARTSTFETSRNKWSGATMEHSVRTVIGLYEQLLRPPPRRPEQRISR